MYVFVRTDMPLANQLVQVGHTCLEAGARFEQLGKPCSIVLLAITCEVHLMRAVETIEQQSVRMFTFHEPDFPPGCTAACTEPVTCEKRRLFRKFRLWSADGGRAATEHQWA